MLNIKESPSKVPFPVGRVEKRMSDYAKTNNIKMASKSIYMSDDRLTHATRPSKGKKNLVVSDADLSSFPSRRYMMNLYYDSHNKNFVYQDVKNKYIINPYYEIRTRNGKTRHVLMVTASIITDINEFRMQKYHRI